MSHSGSSGRRPTAAAGFPPPHDSNGLASAESSMRSIGGRQTAGSSARLQQAPSSRATGSTWGLQRHGALPPVQCSYRQSNMRRSTSSRAGGDVAVDPFTPIKVLDERGVNRTPKSLVAIVPSAALRAARGLTVQDSSLGSESSEAMMFGELSCATFSRGWFDSGGLTPQEGSSADLDYSSPGSRAGPAAPAAIMGGDQTPRRVLRVSGSGSIKSGDGGAGLSASGSQRPSRTQPDGSTAAAAAARAAAAGPDAAAPLSQNDLAAVHSVLLQETDTIVMWEQRGVVAAADSAEGAQVAAANAAYAAKLADCDAADKRASACSQTPAPLRKHREVQSGCSSTAAAGCQVTAYDLHDAYAVDGGDAGEEAEEQLSSVLPSGAAVATSASGSARASMSHSTSFVRGSPSAAALLRPGTVSSVRSSSLAGWNDRRTTAMDSRPTSAHAGGLGAQASGMDARGAAAAALLVAGAQEAPEAWTQLSGLPRLLEVVEAALSQTAFMPQLLQYRDIKPPQPLLLTCSSASWPQHQQHQQQLDSLSGAPSLAGAGSGQLSVVPPTPSMQRGSVCSTPGSGRPTGEQLSSSVAHTPHPGGGMVFGSGSGLGSARASAVGAFGMMSATGAHQASMLLSRRPSTQTPFGAGLTADSRQSSLMSMGSSRVFRCSRPPAGLQLLWTWSCSLTEGRPISGLSWSANPGLVAAGYGPRPAPQQQPQQQRAPLASMAPLSPSAAAVAAARGAAANAEAGLQQGGALLPAAGEAKGDQGAEGGGGDGDDDDDGGAGGRVALWSLKNQFHPVWTFPTKSGVTSVAFSVRSPHMLAVGMHDGTVAVFDVRSRRTTPAHASTAANGKHADPVWQVRWIDPGSDREEQLVSISTDGRVKAWTVAKGLEHVTLITLKRIPHRLVGSAGGASSGAAGLLHAATAAPGGAAKASASLPPVVAALRGDAQISRNTGGMSFDFSAVDRRMYLAGTEDGLIHKCSTSYSEQYMESYHGHIGPVYGLQWSPFEPRLFLSCSGDWTIRLWQEGRRQQLMSFQSSNKEVLDVAWCPHNSTVFGSVTADGRLELWDFAVSTLRPVTQHAITKAAMTTLLFAQDAPVVLASTDAGQLMVFRLVNIASDRHEPPELQHSRLEEALRANITKGAATLPP